VLSLLEQAHYLELPQLSLPEPVAAHLLFAVGGVIRRGVVSVAVAAVGVLAAGGKITVATQVVRSEFCRLGQVVGGGEEVGEGLLEFVLQR